MNKPQFVYVTYIASTLEKVFDALTDSELTKQYWFQSSNVSDWKPGSKWEHRRGENPARVMICGEVVENARPKRLVVTWAHPEEARDASKVSRVTYDLEPHEESVKLTVTHSELEPESKMLAGISKGWPLVLSNLKSFLECGKAAVLNKSTCS